MIVNPATGLRLVYDTPDLDRVEAVSICADTGSVLARMSGGMTCIMGSLEKSLLNVLIRSRSTEVEMTRMDGFTVAFYGLSPLVLRDRTAPHMPLAKLRG